MFGRVGGQLVYMQPVSNVRYNACTSLKFYGSITLGVLSIIFNEVRHAVWHPGILKGNGIHPLDIILYKWTSVAD